MPSSQNMRSESEMVRELRPVMPADLFKAVMKGDRNLYQRLGLTLEKQTECHEVTMEGISDSDSEEINTENQTVRSDRQSATRFGDTVLHLFYTDGHNGTDWKDFERYVSLFKAQNDMLETPLNCAAKVTMEGASHSAPEDINTENRIIQSEIEWATSFVGKILDLHFTEGHNKPDLRVFHRFVSQFKAQNNMLETSLQCAAKVKMEGASHSATEEINTENQTVQFELQSATRFGDTILHLLVTKGHNELALKVFEKDMSLFKARNNMLETPLHCAAKVGNHMFLYNLIQSDCVVVKDALAQTNTDGDTALHVAAKNGHVGIAYMIMNLDPEMAFKVNNKLSPLYLAIVNEHTKMVQIMLGVDPTLACTPFSDGMFPVHEAARTGNVDLVKHFMIYFPDDAELLDPCGRNLFHIAAEAKKDFFGSLFRAAEKKKDIFSRYFRVAEEKKDLSSRLFKSGVIRELIKRMNTARDYEGNTPFHIASIVGDKNNMYAIWEHIKGAERVRNNQGLTPFQLSARQQLKTTKDSDVRSSVNKYIMIEGYEFTKIWFSEVMIPITDKWDRAQIIGLGSVLITTVTFAAALTIPGGYNQDHGTPILGRRYMFKAFVLANALAFILGFMSLFALLWGAVLRIDSTTLIFSSQTFMLAASSMVIAFGSGMYVTLAPVCHPIAVLLLVISLFCGSPYGFFPIMNVEILFRFIFKHNILAYFIGTIFTVPFLFTFCLALL